MPLNKWTEIYVEKDAITPTPLPLVDDCSIYPGNRITDVFCVCQGPVSMGKEGGFFQKVSRVCGIVKTQGLVLSKAGCRTWNNNSFWNCHHLRMTTNRPWLNLWHTGKDYRIWPTYGRTQKSNWEKFLSLTYLVFIHFTRSSDLRFLEYFKTDFFWQLSLFIGTLYNCPSGKHQMGYSNLFLFHKHAVI